MNLLRRGAVAVGAPFTGRFHRTSSYGTFAREFSSDVVSASSSAAAGSRDAQSAAIARERKPARHIVGAFQFSILVGTRAEILPVVERASQPAPDHRDYSGGEPLVRGHAAIPSAGVDTVPHRWLPFGLLKIKTASLHARTAGPPAANTQALKVNTPEASRAQAVVPA